MCYQKIRLPLLEHHFVGKLTLAVNCNFGSEPIYTIHDTSTTPFIGDENSKYKHWVTVSVMAVRSSAESP